MSFLSYLLRYANKHERSGASFDDPEARTVLAGCDPATFLRALPLLFSSDAFVYFECTTEKSFQDWLSDHSVAPPLNVAVDILWPRPDYWHLPLAPDLITEAAELVERKGMALPSIHLHVHDGTRVLLYWHDAFGDDPMYIANSIPAERVTGFVHALGITDVPPRPAT